MRRVKFREAAYCQLMNHFPIRVQLPSLRKKRSLLLAKLRKTSSRAQNPSTVSPVAEAMESQPMSEVASTPSAAITAEPGKMPSLANILDGSVDEASLVDKEDEDEDAGMEPETEAQAGYCVECEGGQVTIPFIEN